MMPDPEALVFDVFGTVVDWRSTIIREGAALVRHYKPDPETYLMAPELLDLPTK